MCTACLNRMGFGLKKNRIWSVNSWNAKRYVRLTVSRAHSLRSQHLVTSQFYVKIESSPATSSSPLSSALIRRSSSDAKYAGALEHWRKRQQIRKIIDSCILKNLMEIHPPWLGGGTWRRRWLRQWRIEQTIRKRSLAESEALSDHRRAIAHSRSAQHLPLHSTHESRFWIFFHNHYFKVAWILTKDVAYLVEPQHRIHHTWSIAEVIPGIADRVNCNM